MIRAMTTPSPSESLAVAATGPAAGSAAGEVAGPAGPGAPSGEGEVRLLLVRGRVATELRGEAALAELPKALRARDTRVWVDLCGAPAALVVRVGENLGLHPLLVEDMCERDQRAKLEQVDGLLHLVVFSLGWDEGAIYDRELDFVLGARFLLSSHSRWWDPRSTRLLRAGPAAIMKEGLDYLLWALCDDVIDAYFPLLDRLGDEIDSLEDEVVGHPDRALLERLFELKRSLIQIRRVTAPEREMFNILSNRELAVVSAQRKLYFRDSYDHLIRLTDELDTYRELASATLETYLSTVNNNLSEIMKRLTGVTVVVAGVGALAGIFGMSEAQNAFRAEEGPGFWIVTAACLVTAAACAAILRRIDGI
jgi:magnesium transporter